MTSDEATTGGVARLLRRTGFLLAALVVVVPIPVGLALAWQLHPLVVLPAYLLGIPAWLSLVSGAWLLVRRLVPARTAAPPEPGRPAGEGQRPDLPVIRTDLRLLAPRTRGSSASDVRTPTP